jgi:hypothetical protein
MDHNHISQPNAFILKLPDELLDMIISAVEPIFAQRWEGYFQWYPKVYGMAVTLSRVCRRFNHISVPYIYSELSVGTHKKSPPKSLRYLHHSLRENPLLWKLCQSLSVRYDRPKSGSLHVLTDCISWFTEVKDLKFWCFDSTNVDELLRLATEHMDDCRSLSLICRLNYDLHLPSVIAVLGDFESGLWPHLRTLRLDGVSINGDKVCQTELGVSIWMSNIVIQSNDLVLI